MTEWQPIETAPKDGTVILGLQWGRYAYERGVYLVWWQPEFEAFIEGCRQHTLRAGYTFANGSQSELHSPQIPGVTWWQPFLPPTAVNTATRDSQSSGTGADTTPPPPTDQDSREDGR